MSSPSPYVTRTSSYWTFILKSKETSFKDKKEISFFFFKSRIHIHGPSVQQNKSHPKIMDEKKSAFSRSFEDAKEKEISFSSLMVRVKTVTGCRSGSNISSPDAALQSLFVSMLLLSTAALKALRR